MEKGEKLDKFVTFRVPASYGSKLERARRALGARSVGEVVRVAVDRLLNEVVRDANKDKR
jgi:hypothetical protein